MKDLFKNRSFVFLWMAQGASGLAQTFAAFILSWLVYGLTGSKVAMGSIWVAYMAPSITVQLLAGPYLDRWNRRRVMIFSQWTRAAIFVAPAVLYPLGLLELWHLYTVSVILGSVDPLFSPSSMAFVAEILPREHLMKGNSILEGTAQALMLAGPALGGLLVTFFGAAPVLGSLIFFLALAGVLLCLIPGGGRHQSKQKETWFVQFREGLQFFRCYPVLFWVGIVLMLTNFSHSAAFPMYLPFVLEELQGNAFQYGLFTSAFSVGMVLGSIVTGILKEPGDRRKVMLGSLFASGLLLESLGWQYTYALALAAVLGMGFFSLTFTINNTTFYQRRVPENLRGRVFAVRILLAQAGSPVGAALGGVFAEFLGVRVLFMMLGALAVLVPAAAWLSPVFRQLNDTHIIQDLSHSSARHLE
jgi:MFS family permease